MKQEPFDIEVLKAAMDAVNDQTPAYISHPKGRLQPSAYVDNVYVLAPSQFTGESEPLVIVPESYLRASRAFGIPDVVVASWYAYRAEAQRIEKRGIGLPFGTGTGIYGLDLSGS